MLTHLVYDFSRWSGRADDDDLKQNEEQPDERKLSLDQSILIPKTDYNDLELFLTSLCGRVGGW